MELFVDEVVKTVFAALVPIVAGAVLYVLKLLAKKFGLQISAEVEARTNAMVRNALYLTEEKFASLAKKGLKPVETKLQMATRLVLDKVPGITTLEAQALIEQELPKVGLGAAGFARSVVTAATNDAR